MPKVSIILSIFRSEKYLSLWLSKVSNQSIWTDAELVLVANSPSAYELTCINNFKLKWPSQFQLSIVERESLYKSWNRAIDMSSGEYLAIANVDDIRNYDGLKLQVDLLEKNPETLFCFAPFYVTRNFGDEQGRLADPLEFDNIELTRSMLLGPFFIWRRSENVAIKYFDEQLFSGGDFDFAVRLAIHGHGIKLNSTVGFYLDIGQGLSTGSALQPIERTVVDLRYGIYDKLDYEYLAEALKYNIQHIKINNKFFYLGEFIPNYKDFISERKNIWFRYGMKIYLLKTSFFYKFISWAKYSFRNLMVRIYRVFCE
jgi:glycosyltransferase involved in cell wall biosynthesis